MPATKHFSPIPQTIFSVFSGLGLSVVVSLTVEATLDATFITFPSCLTTFFAKFVAVFVSLIPTLAKPAPPASIPAVSCSN